MATTRVDIANTDRRTSEELLAFCLHAALAVFGFALSQVDGSGVVLGPTLSWVLEVGGVVIGLGAAGCLGILLAMRFGRPVRELAQ